MKIIGGVTMKKVVIASLSGGRDSTAMVVKMLESKEQLDYIIFCDTGAEFPEMIAYLKKLDKYLNEKFNKRITWLDDNSGDIIRWAFDIPYQKGDKKGQLRGLPVSLGMSFCTRETKVKPTARFVKKIRLAHKEDIDVEICIGYVAHENRQASTPYADSVRYPLKELGWDEPEVTEFLKERGIYNPLYEHFSRTGCYFCPKQSLRSWLSLYIHHRDLWEQAKAYERKAKELGCHIITWRADYSLEDLEARFKRTGEDRQLDFSALIDWNDEPVSCFCK